jgi:hypothetical protein
MANVFLSYAREDKERARQLAQALQDEGLSVWWDRDIPAGKTFDDVIQEEINTTHCIVVLWSKDSVKSRWVRTEAAEGADRDILVPVLIDKVPIPLAFRRIQAVDLIDWNGKRANDVFKRLVNDISALTQMSRAVSETALAPVSSDSNRREFRNVRSADVQRSVASSPDFASAERLPPPGRKKVCPERISVYAALALLGIGALSVMGYSGLWLFVSGLGILAMLFGPKGPFLDIEMLAIFVASAVGFFGSMAFYYWAYARLLGKLGRASPKPAKDGARR